MNLIMPVAVWQVEASGPCRQCAGPGGYAYILERADTPEGSFCSPTCWGHWWDDHVQLTGTAPDRREPPMPWPEETWTHIAGRWGPVDATRPGMTRAVHLDLDHLVYRDETGQLQAILRRATSGRYDVLVNPVSRGRGIGKALMRAAGREWGVDLAAQRLTDDGSHLVARIDPRLRGN